MATKYPKQARTGRKGVEFVSHVANECGSIFRSFDTADVGIDGAIEFVNERDEPTGDLVLVQIKAGRSHIKAGRFVIQGDRDHFETWARYPVPIVGIVCDTDANEAHWVDISEHLRHHPDRIVHGPYTIEAPSDQVFSVDSFGAFAKAFGRARVDSTSVDVSPNFLIRPWKPADTNPTRALLSAIAGDYPDFDNVVRRLDDASLMREFFPLRLHLVNKGYAIVPIFVQWVRAMLSTVQGLTSGSPTIQKLRVDNVYYCYPKLSRLVAGDLVIFYEPAKGGGSRSAIGCAVIREAVVDSPDVLFGRFSERGVYCLADIRRHAARGRAMAIHFEMFEPFGRPVTLDEIREILGNGTNIQGLTGITRDQFERLRLRGLSLGE